MRHGVTALGEWRMLLVAVLSLSRTYRCQSLHPAACYKLKKKQGSTRVLMHISMFAFQGKGPKGPQLLTWWDGCQNQSWDQNLETQNCFFSDQINDELLERQPISCQKASARLGTLFGYSSCLPSSSSILVRQCVMCLTSSSCGTVQRLCCFFCSP